MANARRPNATYIPLAGVGGWHWAIPPDARILRWGYQHVGI